MRLSLLFSLLIIAVEINAQARLVINDNAYVVIDNSAYLVIENPATNAITTAGTGGNIISEAETDRVKWNVGTTTGAYTVPFTKSAGVKIPLTVTIGTAGAGAGNVTFSTYTGGSWDNNTYKPTDVTDMYNGSGGNNSAYVIDRFWIIDALSYTTRPALTNIQFTYVDAEHSAGGNTITESSLFAQRYDPAPTSTWFGFNGTSGTANTAANTVTSGTVSTSNFRRSWTLVDIASPLPIELLYFRGSCDGSAISLEWATASETNNSFFTIERSDDGTTWYTIKTVQGAVNSTSTLYYDLTDGSTKDIVYYRIKQTDLDGTSATSNIISVTCGEANQDLQVFPNPTHGNFTLMLQGFTDKVTLTVHDVLGQLVKELPSTLYSGKNYVEFNLNDLADATYFLNVSTAAGFKKNIKVVKGQ